MACVPGDAELAGSPAFASREVFRRVLEDVDALGFEVMAAIEYEIRIWDEEGAPTSSGISYSERDRPIRAFLDEAPRARGPRHRGVRGAHGGRTGPARA